MITSVRNPKVRQMRALQAQAKRRRELGAFVVEGARLADEALMSGWPIRQAFYTEGLAETSPELVRALQARGIAEPVSESVMRSASDTQSPQGVLLEVELKPLPLPGTVTFVLVLDGVADPGNMGTLLRSAAAADCDVVLCGPGCADPFSPKVLRSGMGGHFRQPVLSVDWTKIAQLTEKHKLNCFLAEAWEGQPYDTVNMHKPLALILGGEARGSGEHAAALNPTPVQIPMPGRMESLNVAAAGSVLLFEIVRQCRMAAAK